MINNLGLFHPYPIDRPLTDWEIAHRLEVSKPVPSAKSWPQLSVIRMNSTYLECVDKFFPEKGIISAGSVTLIVTFVSLFLFVLYVTIDQWHNRADERVESIFALLFFFTAATGIVLAAWFLILRYEIFRFTHYPMRFNRKNRMVYVTRMDGTVMVESWDKLFFGLAQHNEEEPDDWCDIRGHRLAEDGKTVLETFALAVFGEMSNIGMFCQWEFIRRYMEEGPQELVDDLGVVMDITDRRESFWEGHDRLTAEIYGTPLYFIVFPVRIFYALGRWFAMHTCKIPVWPEEVEKECQIEPNDPYLRDRDHLATTEEFRAAKAKNRIKR